MRLLSFGHIPTWAGGQQNSGLANVIYQLAKHISEIDGADVYLAATDVFEKYKYDGKLNILGWTKRSLVLFIIFHPLLSFKAGIHLFLLKKKFNINESIKAIFFKRVFFLQSIDNCKPEIVHLHDPAAIWYLDLVPSGVKTCLTLHGLCGTDNHRSQREVLYRIENELFHSNKVDAYFFICTLLVSQFITTYGDNPKPKNVIFNSYDKNKFYLSNNCHYEGSHVVRLCTLASLSDIKGQLRVLKALARIPDKAKFSYHCIGDDVNDYSSGLVSFAKANNIKFKYLGRMNPDDIRKHMETYDYMIMPSSSEGFGLTYLESIACGVPVILPKSLPIALEKSIINDSNSVLLEDSGIDSIYNCLINIEKNSFDKKTVSESIKLLGWDNIAAQYYREFNKMI